MNIFQRIDTFFSRSLIGLLRLFAYIFILLSGLVSLALIFVVIFEYDDGIADLSNIELLILAILGLLLYRHISYCRYYGVAIWKRVIMPIYASGMMSVVYSIIFQIIIGFKFMVKPELTFAEVIMQPSKTGELIFLASSLIAIYLSTPTKRGAPALSDTKTDVAEQDSTSSTHVDGVINKQYL